MLIPRRLPLTVLLVLLSTLVLPAANGQEAAYVHRLSGRQERLARGGGSEATEAAVLSALRWLARHQEADGRWHPGTYTQRCGAPPCTGDGYPEHSAGVTGLALLAFLGAGVTHESNDAYMDPVLGKEQSLGLAVQRGLQRLLEEQQADGGLDFGRGTKSMYNHAICTQALAEAYGISGDPRFLEPAQRAVEYLVGAQNPRKAWRYSTKSGENDTSVTGWAVCALISARLSGFAVEQGVLESASGFVKSVTETQSGLCGYMRVEDAGVKVVVAGKNDEFANHEALTAVGMLVRMLIHADRGDAMLDLGAKRLVCDLPVWNLERKCVDYYYWYYGTQALFQYDGPGSNGEGKYWQAWNRALVEVATSHQEGEKSGCAAGSWSPDDRWGFESGRVGATALLALALETYYRHENVFATGK